MIPLRRFSLESAESLGKLVRYLELDRAIDNTFIDILGYIKEHLQAKTIIVEEGYIDKDYSNELSNLYSKTFSSRYGYCKRLHIFKEPCEDLDDFITKFNSNGLNYLGFIVKRPLAVGKVGRTILSPVDIPNCFYLCAIKRDVHLLGKTLVAKGTPYIEQDSMVMTCAQASIWIISKYMDYTHGIKRYLPFEITDSATSFFPHAGRAVPSDGLTLEQMTIALSNIDCFPLFRYRPREGHYDDKESFLTELSVWKPVEQIYPYIESAIPVLINSRNHVYTIVGHKMHNDYRNIDLDYIIKSLEKEEKKIRREKPGYDHTAILPTSVFLDAFIVHDDQYGMYKLLPSSDVNLNLLKTQSPYDDLLYKRPRTGKIKESFVYINCEEDTDAFIIPLPEKIYLWGDEILGIVKKLFSNEEQIFNLIDILIAQSEKGNEYARQMVLSSLISGKNPIVLRTYFIKSSQFKALIRENDKIGTEIRECYLNLDLPFFIWIVEVSIYDIYGKSRKILGEIIFDTTGNRYDQYGIIITVHLPGFFYQNKIGSNSKVRKEDIPPEEPYSLMLRPEGICELPSDEDHGKNQSRNPPLSDVKSETGELNSEPQPVVSKRPWWKRLFGR